MRSSASSSQSLLRRAFRTGRAPRVGWLLVPALASIALLAAAEGGMFARSDLLLQGFLYRTGEPHIPPPVTIVAIDERSLDALGAFPWRREEYRRLVEALAPARPAVLGVDIGFFDRTAEDPALLGETLARTEYPVVLAAKAQAIRPAEAGELPEAAGLQLPLQEFLRGEHVSAGIANVFVGRDRTVRRVPAAVRDGDDVVPGFSVAVVRALAGEDTAMQLAQARLQVTTAPSVRFDGSASVTVPMLGLHVDRDGAYQLQYAGGSATFPVVSFIDVVESRADPALFRGRVVLVGATALDLHDMVHRPGPGAGAIPGVEAHAHAVASMLAGDVLLPQTRSQGIWLTLFAAFLAAFAARYLRTGRALAATVALLAAVPVGAAVAFSLPTMGAEAGRLVPMTAPLAAAVLGATGTFAWRVAIEEREKAYLRRAFTRYVSPEVVRELVADPGKLSLGGERRELSVLFSDLRGFTTLSEGMAPEELVGVLNACFDLQTRIVLEERGVIDKFIGDALMAFWGAPLEEPRHAARACAAAMAMVEGLPVLNRELAARGLPPLAFGIGVHSGPAVVGNMGSSERFDFTAIGDTVNLASRLEGLTKHYGVPVIVSDATRAAAGDEGGFRLLDRVRVKGRSAPVDLNEPIALNDAGGLPLYALRHEEGLHAARERRWEDAAAAFDAVLALRPGDGPATLLRARVDAWKLTPPPEGWDGSTAFTSK